MYYLKKVYNFLKLPQKKSILSSIIINNKRQYQDIKIGNVIKAIIPPKNPHLVPISYLGNNISQSVLQHLQWIMKKDILGQDIFLIGVPGPFRSRIILQYLELMQREVEYVVLSRDTTETDLKQRREILNGTAHYVDQSAVKAAIEGRFLILDGVEKVERNVLPVLNNLLENREMQLEDGRFLIASERYDKLLQEHSQETLDNWKLVRVSENFRVAALGLPVPPFKGNPLDPPFRSRFQARDIQLNYKEQLSELSLISNKLPQKLLQNFISVCYAFQSSESESLGMPKFPIENLPIAVKILSKVPNIPLEQLFAWMYPYNLILSKEGQKSVLGTLKTFGIIPQNVHSDYVVKFNKNEKSNYFTHKAEFSGYNKNITCDVLGHENAKYDSIVNFVPNVYHNNILANMLKTHTEHDFCIIGNKGSGKSVLARKFASILNYPIEMVMLYADMTARDLLQQRITDEKGNTLWRSSQLVNAAKEGKLLVLDGLHRVHSSTLSVLQRLIHNREIQLYDGTRLLNHNQYETIKEKSKFTDIDMKNRKIERIHPAFRIIALAETPKIHSSKDQWITSEMIAMCFFHSLRPLSLEEEKYVIKELTGKENKKIDIIINFAHKLRNSDDETLKSISGSFSTRQLLRLAQRLCTFPDVSIFSLITQACLLKFLPQLTKQAVENLLEQCDITNSNANNKKKVIYSNDNKLSIGSTSVPIYNPGESKIKVPNILFYNNQEHLEIMEAMLQDFMLGEHLLLIGNQGVGKNKITDRFLQLLNRPREYIQLHRDTTVQSLTQQPTVVAGKIVYEDSPLLKAVLHGHVLIVDEADKAPTHVTSILKALVESGEMMLSDGRCIVHYTDLKSKNDPNKVIMHPDFRMIVLANRPGFPFLGNDFFATLGDIFSCHAVDNPSSESEIAMLQQYASNVPVNVLKKLTKLFGELRSMSDAGLISYPYSTRELVSVTRHIGKFPNESIAYALKNVFDFDSYSSDLKDTIHNLLKKYGIPMETETVTVNTAQYYKLPKLSLKSNWSIGINSNIWVPKIYELIFDDECKWPVNVEILDVTEARGSVFSEQMVYLKLPLKSNDIPLSIDSSHSLKDSTFYVATANPISLYAVNENKLEVRKIKLSSYFPTIRNGFKPLVKLSALALQEEVVLFHEISTRKFFIIEPLTGIVRNINIASFFEDTISKITNVVYSRSVSKPYSYVDFPSKKKILIFKENSNKLSVLDFENKKIYHLNTPQTITSISVFNEIALLLVLEENNFVVDISNPKGWQARQLHTNDTTFDLSNLKMDICKDNLIFKNLPSIPKESFNTVILNSKDYATLISGTPLIDHNLSVYGFSRKSPIIIKNNDSCLLPDSNQIIRLLNSKDINSNIRNKFQSQNLQFIEVINLNDLMFGYIAIDLPHISSSFASWLAGTSESYLQMCCCPNEEILTIDLSGFVRRWQTNKQHLESSFVEWQNNLGMRNGECLTIEYVNPNDAVAPKHGQIDPTGNPHVGGNIWAGGTGGRDTAGLGGKGGPYRLDAGHTVYQLPDSEKEAVPLEIREAARKMALKAFKNKLKEIDMSEYDAELYENFLANVKKQVNILRVILDGLQAKSKERLWMKHQTSGELDDTKLIESITGEKSVYKKRGEQEPEIGSPQEKPKLLRLVVDVSGSMYRFNGHDNRLQRELESIVLVMEAFDGYNEKFKYEIVGHSGEDFDIKFSQFNKPPKNDKDKLDVIKKMYAHSQFCMSGDNTLPAAEHAVKTITNEDADEYFVIILSDANFDRYGISPIAFSNILTSNSKVNAFSIFIGSLGNQANMLSKQMPTGHAFICFDSANLTQILQKIFTSTLLRD